MSWLPLGLLQSILEFLPISSSFHLELIAHFFSLPIPSQMVNVALHCSTLLSLLFFFRPTFMAAFKEIVDFFLIPKKRSPWNHFVHVQLFIQLGVASIPAIAVGAIIAIFFKKISLTFAQVGVVLIIGGIGMMISERLPTKRRLEELNFFHLLGLGCFQVAAFLPGMSRLGSCLIGSRVLGLSKAQSLFFSFFLSLPSIGGAVVLLGIKDRAQFLGMVSIEMVLVLLFCAVVGFGALRLIYWFINRFGLIYFSIYRIILGLGLILFC
jgi:undecaprenyl-diphosphatase